MPLFLAGQNHEVVALSGGGSGGRPIFERVHIEVFLLLPDLVFSARNAPIRRSAEASLGKMRITRSRLLISSFNRSCIFVVRNRLRYFSGNAMTAIASSNPPSRQATALEDVNRIQSDVTWGFVCVDEAGFERYRPTSFRQLFAGFGGK